MLLGAPHLDPVATLGEHVADLFIRRHQFALLVDDDPRQGLGQRHRALVRLKLAGQQPQQSRLARAIGPDQADAVAALHPQRKVADDGPLVEAFPNSFGVDHRLGFGLVPGQRQLRRPGGAEHRRPLRPHVVQLGEPALVAAATGGDPALEPVQFDGELGVELVGGARLLGIDALGPCLEAAKADFGPPDLAAIEPQAAFGQPGQEGAVVTDDDEGALETFEPILEPADRSQIEMVGRLVEQQHVRRLRQRPDDRRPPPLAAAGGRRRAVEVDAELLGNGIGRMRCRSALARQHPVGEAVMPGDRRVLLQQHHLRPRHDRPPPLVGLNQVGEAFQQRRLAGAVAADQRQPVARADEQIEPAEQPAFALDQAEILVSQNGGCHAPRSSLAWPVRHLSG